MPRTKKETAKETVKETVKQVADTATANEIETKKTVRATARKTRAKADETKTTAKAKAAKKVADIKEVGQAVAAEVDDAKTAVKIETKKPRGLPDVRSRAPLPKRWTRLKPRSTTRSWRMRWLPAE